MEIFSDAQGQLTPQSLVLTGRISNLFEMLWMSTLPESIKKIRSKVKALEWSQTFSHYSSILELSVAMDTRVPIRSGPKPNAAFPRPNDGSVKILLRLANWLWRYSSLKMFKDGSRIDRYTISSPRAFGSGELKIPIDL